MANPRHLYELEDFFRLEVGGVFTFTEEPIQWDKVSIKSLRDADFYGMNYEFIDDKISLIFAENEGMAEIEAVYKTEGGDGQIFFEYGFIQQGIERVQFRGQLNLNTYRITDEGVECQIEKIPFDHQLRTRSEVKVSMTQTKDFNGNAIVPPSSMKVKLHSKRLRKIGRAEQSISEAVDRTSQHGGSNPPYATKFIQPDTQNIVKSEIGDFFAMPVAITAVRPEDEERFQFKAIERGIAKLKFGADYLFTREATPITAQIKNLTLQPLIYIFREGSLLQVYEDLTAKLVYHRPTEFTVTDLRHKFDVEVDADLQIGDMVYFIVRKVEDAGAGVTIDTVKDWKGYVEVIQETMAEPSICDGWRPIHVLNHIVNALTGKKDAVKSKFFEQGGPGWNWIMTNGFQIRLFDTANKPMTISWKDALEGLAFIWNLGLQNSLDSQGKPEIRIEHFDEFFQPNRITHLEEIHDYEEVHSADITYNEVEVGYQKFPEEELNTLDEFNTYQTWLTPIKTFKNKLPRRSKLIASGYAIEILRREQFKTNPSTSLGNDDETFLISINEKEAVYPNLSWSMKPTSIIGINNGTMQLDRGIGLEKGDTFTIKKAGGVNGANGATVFTVLHRMYGQSNSWMITPRPVAESGVMGEVRIQLTQPQAEKDEAFAVVANVLSPETAYNLRISPKRILMNYGTLLNAGLMHKLNLEELTCTYFKNNADLETQFQPNEPFKLIHGNPLIREKDAVKMQDFQARTQHFLPITCRFKSVLRYDKLIELMDAYRGIHTNPNRNYGIVTFHDFRGELWEGVVWSVEYDPVGGVATFEVRKKRKL